MLVLTRKLGERILIGDDITITVVDIGHSRLKLGIEAPAGCRILRSELVIEDDGDTDALRSGIEPGRPSRNEWAAKVPAAVGV